MARPWKIVDLDSGDSLKACLRRIAETRFQEMFSYEHETLKGEDAEALHDMRVSARRLRAILRIFRACFPKKKLRKQDEKLQGIIRSLGAVRERDVFIELITNYRKTLAPKESHVFELLLAREESLRMPLKRQLSRNLQVLRRSKYRESFSQFLKDSL